MRPVVVAVAVDEDGRVVVADEVDVVVVVVAIIVVVVVVVRRVLTTGAGEVVAPLGLGGIGN